MHPAYSIIWFTTLSGTGYGLAFFLGLGLAPVTGPAAFFAYGMAFGLICTGLISSTLHLGHPERAWRAFSQWRSSWLSREGVLAVVTFIPLSVCAISSTFFGLNRPVVGLGLTVLAACTVYSTSMIYASLKTIHQWHSWITSACYLGFAASSGFLLLITMYQPLFETGRTPLIAITLITLAWIIKGFWWHRADTTASASTIQSALGLPENVSAQRLELPHTGTNYLMKEMGHRVARKHGQKLRIIAVFSGFVVPVICLIIANTLTGTPTQIGTSAAAIAHFGGIIVERWLFFAQARHTVTLYYGAEVA